MSTDEDARGELVELRERLEEIEALLKDPVALARELVQLLEGRTE